MQIYDNFKIFLNKFYWKGIKIKGTINWSTDKVIINNNYCSANITQNIILLKL